MKLRKIILTSVMMLVFAYSSIAQTVAFLDINPDTKTLGNGGISSVAPASAFSLWNNSSATVLDKKKFDIGASYTMWQPDMADNKIYAIGAYTKISKFMAITAGFKQFAYNEIVGSDEAGAVKDSFTPKENSLGVGLAFKILPCLSVSADVNIYNSKIWEDYSASGAAFNIGATYKKNNITVALTANNLGSSASYADETDYKMPSSVKVGTSYDFSVGQGNSVVKPMAQFGLSLADESSVFGAVGAEYLYKNVVRAGVAYHYGDKAKYIPSHLSVGAGVSFYGISLNAAYLFAADNSAIGNTLSVGLSYGF